MCWMLSAVDDVDAGIEHLHHILPTLQMPGAGHIGMGQFVDQRQLRTAHQQRIEIELVEHLAAIFDLPARQDFEA